jgi:hypothetical protein
LKKICAAAITGAIAICFANPMDVVKVRMQAMAQEIGNGKMPSSGSIYGKVWKDASFRGFYIGL